jgi:predicted flavoprotein YhiN
VIATGGPSIPKMGATGFAYDLARQFGLKVVEPRPALVPLTLGGEETLFRSLSGVATEVVARAGKTSFREAALFTHKGLSGPAILQISSYWRSGERSGSTSCPPGSRLAARRQAGAAAGAFPHCAGRGAAGAAGGDAGEADRPVGRTGQCAGPQAGRDRRRLSDWRFHPNGTEGFAKAEVTAGGISTAELSSQTMEARKRAGALRDRRRGGRDRLARRV